MESERGAEFRPPSPSVHSPFVPKSHNRCKHRLKRFVAKKIWIPAAFSEGTLLLKKAKREASDDRGDVVTLDNSGILRTVLVVVLFRHVILRHFVRAHFALVRVPSGFHSAHYPRFERLSFFQQFLRAFRVGALDHGNAA